MVVSVLISQVLVQIRRSEPGGSGLPDATTFSSPQIDIVTSPVVDVDHPRDLFIRQLPRSCTPARAAESIGRPLGDDRFLARIERLTGLSLKPRKTRAKAAGSEIGRLEIKCTVAVIANWA